MRVTGCLLVYLSVCLQLETALRSTKRATWCLLIYLFVCLQLGTALRSTDESYRMFTSLFICLFCFTVRDSLENVHRMRMFIGLPDCTDESYRVFTCLFACLFTDRGSLEKYR